MFPLTFRPVPDHEPGIIFSLLKRAYADMRRQDPDFYTYWEPFWQVYDEHIFKYPRTVGECGFVSYADDELVGFASWDPRQRPTCIIGHNVILPEFRQNRFGMQQMTEVIRRIRARGFSKAVVTTNEHPFFRPAQRMYRACGFTETRRFIGDDPNHSPMIEYELLL